jgi:phosphoribosylformylglycinamidine cyclo-ligase
MVKLLSLSQERSTRYACNWLSLSNIATARLQHDVKKSSWPVHKIFDFIQKSGPVEEEEMYQVFNMGIGYVLIVAEDFADSIEKKLVEYGEKVYKIGRITTGTQQVVLK